MTGRDRVVAIAAVALVLLGGVWMLLVSPERQQAAKLSTLLSTAGAQLASAEGQLASARSAQARYAAAYSSIVRLGKAVPPSQEVPSLIYQLARATKQRRVDFTSIASGSGSGSPTSGSSSSSSPAAAAVAAGGLTQMPFTFVFNGSFADLYHLFQQLNGYTRRTASGGLDVSGRLLTIQSVKLAPLPSASSGAHGAAVSTGQLTGTVTATAYVLPASQGLTGGATAASPAAGSGAPTSTAASSTGSAASPAAPAIVRVNP